METVDHRSRRTTAHVGQPTTRRSSSQRAAACRCRRPPLSPTCPDPPKSTLSCPGMFRPTHCQTDTHAPMRCQCVHDAGRELRTWGRPLSCRILETIDKRTCAAPVRLWATGAWYRTVRGPRARPRLRAGLSPLSRSAASRGWMSHGDHTSRAAAASRDWTSRALTRCGGWKSWLATTAAWSSSRPLPWQL